MKRYALVIGISEYDSTNLGKLSKPANDAKAVAAILREHGGFQDITLLNSTVVNKQKVLGRVNYEALDAELTKFLEQAKNQDALIYFTGHGFTMEESRFVKRGYLATSSCKVKFKEKRIISQEEGFSFDDLNGLIQEANLSSLLMLLDCCHSGFLIEDDLVKKSLLAFSRNNYCLIAACRSFQESYALKSQDHSVFTGTLLDSLLEKNARQGTVTALDAFGHIDRELRGSGQEPIFLGMGGAIPVVSYQVVTEAPLDETCPYQGLEAFTEATAQFFFGRQKDVETLWQNLEQTAFVPVIGASGSGKSSLVRAGLIPALKQSGANWTVLELIKPGEEPLAQVRQPLEELVRQIPGKVQLSTLIRKSPEGLQPLIEQLPEGTRFLLVVDQFEEVFTVCLDEEERSRFIDLITRVTAIPDSRLAVVITMRADFVESCLCYESLKTLIQDQAVYLSQLIGADLTDAIAKPVAKQGYHLTPDLLAEIVKDTREEPGFLPLLQFALTKLWEFRDTQAHQLTSDAYATIGKLVGALDSHADQIYSYCDYIDPHTGSINLSPQQSRSQVEQDWIRAIMLRLVRTSEGEKDTRQPQLHSILVELANETSEARQQIELVLESLIKGRLLVSEREMIDLAHEALIKGWKRLAGWCQESRELRRLSQRLEAARLLWKKDQQNPNLKPEEKNRNLMMGGLLAEVRAQWEELKPYLPALNQDKTFFKRSDEYEKNQIAQLQQALVEVKQRQVEAEEHELQALCKSSEGLFVAGRVFDSLIEALRAVHRLRRLTQPSAALQTQVRLVLQQAVYEVQESNRLEEELGRSTRSITGCFSPDGSIFASAGREGVIQLWNAKGEVIKALRGHTSDINRVCFSPHGQHIASVSSDQTLRFWNLKGEILQIFGDTCEILGLDSNFDNQLTVTAGSDGFIKFWSLTQIAPKPFRGHRSVINDVRFSPDGLKVASACITGTVNVWNLDGLLLKSFSYPTAVNCICFHPGGKLLAVGGRDHRIFLWNLDTEEVRALEGHDSWIYSLSFSPDGSFLVSGSADKSLKIWSLQGQSLITLRGHQDWVRSISFSPSGKLIASVSGDGAIKFWKLNSPELRRYEGHTTAVTGVCFSPDDHLIASSSSDRTIKLWNVHTGQPVITLQGHKDWVRYVCFSPDGKTLASTGSGPSDKTVKLWNLEGTNFKTLRGHREWVTKVKFSPNGSIFASSSWDHTVKLWNLEGTNFRTFRKHRDGVIDVCFSPDGQILASASADQTVRLWTIQGEELIALWGHQGKVNTVSFSPHSNVVASGGIDRTIRLWSLDGESLITLRGHQGSIYGLTFSPNGQLIASASADMTIKLWNLQGEELKTLRGHTSEVDTVSFSSDSRLLASASTDRTVRLWNAEVLDLEELVTCGCAWVQDYLQTNPNVESSDRSLCDEILAIGEHQPFID